MKPRRSAGRGHCLFAEQVDSSRLGGLCTDQSSDSGVDQGHGGAPKAGSTGRLVGQGRVSLGSRIRRAEEGVASRQGVESSSLDNPTVKMDQKRRFSGQTPVISKGKPRSRGVRAWSVGNAVVHTTIKEPLGKR